MAHVLDLMFVSSAVGVALLWLARHVRGPKASGCAKGCGTACAPKPEALVQIGRRQ